MNKLSLLSIVSIATTSAFFIFHAAFAQTTALIPQSQNVVMNADFSLILNADSMTNLFGIAFDLNFDPTLVSFKNAIEGNFLSQGCQTSLMTDVNPAGKLIFGLTRLGASCGGVSGSGTIAALNFRSLDKAGTATFSFSNNFFCFLSGATCNYIVGNWNQANVTVQAVSDTTPPTISFTAPSAGSTVSGASVTVSANASDNVGVFGVQFKLDGNNLGTEDTTSPYSITWNTTQTSNGSHTITATARDAAGNQTISSGVSVTVSNATSVSANIEAESGTLTSPMQIVSDTSASGNAYIMTTTSESGTAVYSFSISTAGTYKIVARVYAQNAGTDSFYVKVDNLTEDVWDLNPSDTASDFNVWREDEVTKRGTGTPALPQYDPYTFNLTSGNHTITLRGRETSARLDYFRLVNVGTTDTTPPAAPTGVRVE